MITTMSEETLEDRGETRPTQPADYGALNAVYGMLLGGLVAVTRNGAARSEPIGGAELVPIGAATFALAKVVAKERIGTWVREPFAEDASDAGATPKGRRLRRAVGELVTCTRCVGAWSALAVVGVRMGSPPAGRVVTAVLAASALNDFLQAAFNWLTSKTNIAEAEASAAGG